MMNEEQIDEGVITSIEINRCIAILSQLNNDTNQIFDIPKEQRTAQAAGQFSRPDRDELAEKKMARKQLSANGKRDRTARKETGIRFGSQLYLWHQNC
jgi:DNA-directed RNA polymerase beta subunit